jgi:CRISPR-associated protein (TIGR03984 family)
MSITLFIYSRQHVRLAEVLSAYASAIDHGRATAILYSPRQCAMATFTNGALRGPDGQPMNLTSVFEARVFCETAELRWLNDPGLEQRHRAVILTEQELPLPDDWRMEQQTGVIGKLDQTYLLWGEGTDRAWGNGWSELATARIGALQVPVADVSANQRVLLHSVEYVVEADHGNAVVFDERLRTLEVDRG